MSDFIVMEQVNIVEPAFPVALYEVEKLLKEGYSLSQTREPIYIAGLYDIVLVKGEEVVSEEKAEKAADTTVSVTKKRGPKPKAD